MLEVCVDSLESAINAIHGGADELEICSSFPEGGLTPSPGLVTEIIKMMDNISRKEPIHRTCNQCSCKNLLKKPKMNVMIRCRAGSDFCYTSEEIDTMLSDIKYYKSISVDRFVFGALTSALKVDEKNCSRVLIAAHPIPVTFHRAFDICKNPFDAIDTIANLGFNRLLTSGQQISAGEAEAIKMLHRLVTNYSDRIEIMPGAGVNADNAMVFVSIGCKIVHGSCKRSKQLTIVGNNLSMGTATCEYVYYCDENVVREIKEVLIKATTPAKKEVDV